MDIELNYVEKGSGSVLILLHGNGESHSYFEHQIQPFSQRFRVIAIDSRGHGKSVRGEKMLSIRQFADDLYEFMTEHKIPKANILGFSDGGNIALTFALKHPEMVDKLILNGANLNTAGVKWTAQFPTEIGYRIASAFAGKSEEARKNAEILGLMVNEPNFTPHDLRNLTVPTLVVAGTRDLIKASHTRQIYESLPKAELAIIQGNHFVAKKNPEEFNRVVLQFLVGDSYKRSKEK